MARGLKFQLQGGDGLYYLCSENLDADQLCSYCAADLRLCVAYVKIMFFYDKAHFQVEGLTKRSSRRRMKLTCVATTPSLTAR